MNAVLWTLGLLQVATILLVALFALWVRRAFWHVDARVRTGTERLTILIGDTAQELQDAASIAAIGFSFPVFFGGWSIDASLARRLCHLLRDQRPRTIVELGSGTSTIVIATCMKALQEENYSHVAIDHDARYLRLTRELAILNNVENSIDFCECPLRYSADLNQVWYAGAVEKLNGMKIDLLLVDGPPGTLQTRSRYPALPQLYSVLADKCTVILDDAIRPDEEMIANAWIREFPGFALEILPGGHKAAILTRTSKAGQ